MQMYKALRIFCHLFVLRPLVTILFGVNTAGKEHIPKETQFIIIANHNSHLDIAMLFHNIALSQILQTRVVAAGDYFKKRPLLQRIVSFFFDPIWVYRTKPCLSPVREMAHHLGNGGCLILFPEGTRGTSPEINEFKPGIGFLCQRFPEVPVITVYLEGPERSFPKDCVIPLPLLHLVTAAEPLQYAQDKTASAETLFTRIKNLEEVQTRYRHQHRNTIDTAISVAVIGIDGSGKSSLARALSTGFAGTCCFIGDTLKFYDAGVEQTVRHYITETLRQWIGKKAKLATTLSWYKYPKIIELLLRDQLQKEVKRRESPGLFFLDGAAILNLLAWIQLYSKKELDAAKISEAVAFLEGSKQPSLSCDLVRQFPMLLALSALGLNRLQLPDHVVFLDADPEVCLNRIAERGHRIQPHENFNHLKRLRNAYHILCSSLRTSACKVIILDGNQNKDLLLGLTLTHLNNNLVNTYGTH